MGPARPDNAFALVADIGGTNTRVALAQGPKIRTDTIRRYRNAEHPALEAVLETYIEAEGGVDCCAASVAIAGPVRDGQGTLTNLDWTIDEATLAQATRAERVAVLNDLQAQGHAIGHIAPGKLRTVIEAGPAPDRASYLVIGVGTGFNVAPVHPIGERRLVVASEAGHESLPIRTDEDLRLARYIEATQGFASVEDALSGRGLVRIHDWLGAEAGDPRETDAEAIVAACAEGHDQRATAAVAHFVRLLGSVAGNQALNHLPFGGIFLAGGVARAMAPYLDRFGFAEAFRDKGRFGPFLEDLSVAVIEDDYAALAGSAVHLAHLS